MALQKEPSIKLFTEKFGEAGKLYDVSIREDRFFVSEILALDSFVARLDDVPLFANQLVMINVATLDVSSTLYFANNREFITNMVRGHRNTTPLSNYSLLSSMLSKNTFQHSISSQSPRSHLQVTTNLSPSYHPDN